MFVLTDIMANFLPLMLEYNKNIYNDIIANLLLGVIDTEEDGTTVFDISKLCFSKETSDLRFLPVGEGVLDEFNNLQLYWDEPIDLLHEKGYRDELSFVLYNVSKNKIEHRGFNAVTDETSVDFTFIGLTDEWENDNILVWAIWSRYALDNPKQRIANSEQIYLGMVERNELDGVSVFYNRQWLI